jgi:hypothetical protein
MMPNTNFTPCYTCGFDYFPNQLKVVTTRLKEYRICPTCRQEILDRLANQQFLASLTRRTLPLGQQAEIWSDRRKQYAMSEVPHVDV